MPKNEPPADGIDWRLTTSDGSRREQLRRWAALPLERVILAIEEMQDLTEHFQRMHAEGGIHVRLGRGRAPASDPERPRAATSLRQERRRVALCPPRSNRARSSRYLLRLASMYARKSALICVW